MFGCLIHALWFYPGAAADGKAAALVLLQF